MKKANKIIINKEWDEIFNKYKENNFSNHAFSLVLFTQRLYEQLKSSGCKDVLFMSREGQFLKKLFERYCEIKKEIGQDVNSITTHYFYGSRNSIMTASVKPLAEESFDLMLRYFNFFIKPKMFMYSIGFSEEQIKMVQESFGKKTNRLCLSFKNSKTFKLLKQNDTFKQIYEENRTKQSQAFGKYMNTFNLNYKQDGLCFVDIGYHGTMQDLIYKFFDEKVNMQGYFIKNRAKENIKNSKMGLLGDSLNKKLFGSKINKYDTFNYEQILRADHGRCLGYEVIDETTAKPIIDTKHDDEAVFEKYVKFMQDQIYEKFEIIARKTLTENAEIDKIATIYFYNMVKNKTKADYKWIIDMQDSHHDDFGYVGYPGRAFARWLRKMAFKLKDKIFVLTKGLYVKKLKKSLLDKQ